MKTLSKYDQQPVIENLSDESWSIESAWKEETEKPADENIYFFRLAEGTILLPLEDEFYNLFPLVYETGKTIRIYNGKNRYIDFKLVEYQENGDCLDYYLRYDDEQGSHVFVCFEHLQNSNEKILNPYKMDKYLLKSLKCFWDKEYNSLQEKFDKLKYQQMGTFHKFITRHKKLISYVAWIIGILLALAILWLAIVGVCELIVNWSDLYKDWLLSFK